MMDDKTAVFVMSTTIKLGPNGPYVENGFNTIFDENEPIDITIKVGHEILKATAQAIMQTIGEEMCK